MPLKLRCPSGHEFMVASNRAGTTVRCAKCQEKIVVPPVARKVSQIQDAPPVQQSKKPRSKPPELPTRKRKKPQAESNQPAGNSTAAEQPSKKKKAQQADSKTLENKQEHKERFRTQPSKPSSAAPPSDPPKPPPVAAKQNAPQPPPAPPIANTKQPEPPQPSASQSPAATPSKKQSPPQPAANQPTPSKPVASKTPATKPPSPPLPEQETNETYAEPDVAPAETPDEEEPLEPRGYEHKPEHRLWAYGLGAAMAVLGVFSMSPAVWEIIDFFQHESTTPVAHWAYAAILIGLIQLFYATYVIQFADFSSVWVVAVLSLLSATGYALLVGMVLLGAEDVLAMLHLTPGTRTRALLWCFSNLSITATIAYFAGAAGLRWTREFQQATTSPQS